jgi:hypothetical protein
LPLETGLWKARRDLPVWIALVVLLGVGWSVKSSVESRTTVFADPHGSLRIAYPAWWVSAPGSPAILDVRDPLSGAVVPTGLTVTQEPRPAGQSLDQVTRSEVLARSQQLAMYRVLSVDAVKVGGQDARQIEYAFVADPQGVAFNTQRLPVVVRGLELIVPAGSGVYRIDFRAAGDVFDGARRVWAGIERGIRL